MPKPATSLKKTQVFLCEKCPNTELLLIRIFLHSDWIRIFTEYWVQTRKNTDQKKLLIRILFMQCLSLWNMWNSCKKLLFRKAVKRLFARVDSSSLVLSHYNVTEVYSEHCQTSQPASKIKYFAKNSSWHYFRRSLFMAGFWMRLCIAFG